MILLPDFSALFSQNDAVLQALKFAKWLFLFLFFALLGACNEADEPHFSALDTQNSTSAPLFRCPEPRFLIPQTTIWGIPFHLLGYFKACLCPHIGAVLPSLRADFPHFRAKIAYKRMCISPLLSGKKTTRRIFFVVWKYRNRNFLCRFVLK